ncbi:MAG: type 1 glutamine amidotransferase [Lachnospirales bacterium]
MENYELNLCHLYPDLLNVYGDYGNILILKYRCEQRGIKTNLVNVGINDNFDYKNMDITLIGGGQDFEENIVSSDLFQKKKDIKNYVEDMGVLIGICGGYQLLGDYYVTSTGDKVVGLKLIPVYTEKGDKRIINDIIIEDLVTKEKYVGFENHGGRTFLKEGCKPLGKVLYGTGNNGEDGYEGCVYKNTLGTYLHGSLLAKNEKLCDNLIKRAVKRKYKVDIELEELDSNLEKMARKVILDRCKVKNEE